MKRGAHIVLLPGDGIGPEVVSEARRVLEACGQRFGHRFGFETHRIGGVAIDETGTALPDETLDACRRADAVLLGAVGGPKWDDPRALERPETGLLGLRRALDLYGNIRPVKPNAASNDASVLRPEAIAGVDVVVVRELTAGLYFGTPRGCEQTAAGTRAVDTLAYTDREIARIVRLAFSMARERERRLTSVDKANVLASSRLWRQVVEDVAEDYPDVAFEHQLVDSMAMRLLTEPRSFDVIVTENMFGDILSDEAAVLAGSLGMLPSASLGEGTAALYEPVHGSAPHIAGRNRANPLGAISSGALLLRYSLGLDDVARRLEAAVEAALASGARTADLGGSLSTSEMGQAVVDRLDG